MTDKTVNHQMPDKIFEFIKKYSDADGLGIKYNFEGDWGSWNWIYNRIIDDFVHNNPEYHVIKKSDVDGDVMEALEFIKLARDEMIEIYNADDAYDNSNNLFNAYITIRNALIAQYDPDIVRTWQRGEGQTTEAVKLAKKLNAYLVVRDHKQAHEVSKDDMSLRFPITFQELIDSRMKGSFVRDIVIDDVEDFKNMLLAQVTAGLNVHVPTPPINNVLNNKEGDDNEL